MRDVAVDKFEGFGQSLDFAEVALLEGRVVKVVEVVEGPDAVAIAEEAFANVGADEARAAGDQKIPWPDANNRGGAVERQALAFFCNWPWSPSSKPRKDKSSSKSGQCRPNGEISIWFNCRCVPRTSRGFSATENGFPRRFPCGRDLSVHMSGGNGDVSQGVHATSQLSAFYFLPQVFQLWTIRGA